MQRSHKIKFLFFLLFSVVNFNVFALENLDDKNCKDITTFSISTGKLGGGYYNFATRLNKFLAKECIFLDIVASNGSVDNFNKLKQDEVELAIVQNDVSYKTYQNFKKFSTIFPLFNEYVQLVARKDSKTWFGALKSQPILLGKKNSGTAENAKDVLELTQLTNNFKNGSLCEALQNKTVLAGFVTSKNVQHCENVETENITIPLSILNKLTKNKHYYSKVNVKFGNVVESILSLQAYLVIRNNFDKSKSSKLEVLIKTLGDNWLLLDKNMIPLPEALNTKNPKIHLTSKLVLLENNFIIDPSQEYWYLGLWSFVWLIIYFLFTRDIHSVIVKYSNRRSFKIWSKPWFLNIVSYIQAILIFLIVFSSLTIVIQLTEQLYDPSSYFINMSIWQLMLWVLTFMASGFTSEIYPSGIIAQLIITVLSLIGAFAPLYFLYQWSGNAQENNRNKRRGLVPIKAENHILICGWNEKIPSIVHILTCGNTPKRKQIIIIAEIEGEYPLDKYDFDRKYVAYYRGDSSDSLSLDNISASKAETALIIAGNSKRENKNITSVLTALVLKKINPNIFLTSELVYTNNRQYFESADVDVIFDFHEICNHLVVLATLSPTILDFLLDILTYDDFSEIYSMSVKEIKNKNNSIRGVLNFGRKEFRAKTLALLSKENITGNAVNEFLKNGVNIIGCSQPNNREKGVLATDFRKDKYLFPIVDVKEITGFKDEDTLFYLADEKLDILSLSEASLSEDSANDDFKLVDEGNHNILVISECTERFKKIKALYECMPFSVEVTLFSEVFKNTIIDIDEILKTVEDKNITHVVILSAIESKQKVIVNDRGQLDAVSVLIAKALKNYNPNIIITSELVNLNSKSMLENVGVEAVISQALFVERFFTKIIYNRGLVTDFLMGLLNVSDGQFLHVVDVQKNDYFEGKQYSDIWFNSCSNYRLIACVPIDETVKLKNKEKDFKTHFITNPKTLVNTRIKQGDKLVLIIDIN